MRAWHVIAALGALGAAWELEWLRRYGVASPARALVFVLIASCIGNPLRQGTLGPARVRGFTACFSAGLVAMSTLYLLLRGLHAPRALIVIVVLLLAAWGAWRGRWRAQLMRPVDTVSLLTWSLLTTLCARAEWLAELPQLTLPHPTVFAGIDTPLWLNLAYGLERAVPARELLFDEEALNYHYGAGLLPLLMSATTGLPMHVAHSVSVALCGIGASLLLAQVAQRLFATDRHARRMLGWLMPVIGWLWFQMWVFNLPSSAGNFLLIYVLLELLRARSWRSLGLTFPACFLLLLTKEVSFVAAMLCAGCIILWRRDWAALARLLLTFVATRLLYGPLAHRDQKVIPTLFREHLAWKWLRNQLRDTSIIDAIHLPATWLLAAAALAMPLLLWRKRPRDAATLVGSSFVLLVMFALGVLVRPEFSPPLDEFHQGWAVADMFQFYKLGGHLALLTLLAAAIVTVARWRPLEPHARVLAPAAAVALAWFGDDRYFRIPPVHPDQEHEEYRGDNPVVPVLAQIPVEGSKLAADQLNWNGENPHWAGFFGHQFFCLRRVRWALSYPRYAEVVAKQDAIFSAQGIADVEQLARSESITHVIVDKRRPTRWLTQARPAIETERYAVFTF